jgi:methionyl-tRNA synthetase
VELNDTDKSVLEEVKKEVASIEENIMAYRFRMAQAAMINIARIGNKYLADEEPWKKIKEDPERVKQILRCALEICKTLSQVGHPFLPQTARKLRVMLGIEELGWSVDADLSSLQPAEILFQKVEAEMVETEMARLKPQTEEPEKTDYVEFEDFGKMDLRIGEITAAEKHPDADKLLVLKVQVGEKEHNIVSGIAEHYEPTSLIGKRVCLLANLKPKKLRGIMSEGMILMAEDAEGKLAFLEPDGDMPSGAKVS